jgi:hypothetical protein
MTDSLIGYLRSLRQIRGKRRPASVGLLSWAQPFPRTWMLRPSADMLNHSGQKGQGRVQSKIFALLRGAFDGASRPDSTAARGRHSGSERRTSASRRRHRLLPPRRRCDQRRTSCPCACNRSRCTLDQGPHCTLEGGPHWRSKHPGSGQLARTGRRGDKPWRVKRITAVISGRLSQPAAAISRTWRNCASNASTGIGLPKK